MKQLIAGLLMMIVSQSAFAGSLSLGGGLNHTNNSNYGDSALLLARYEQEVYGPLLLGVEGAWHGPQSHNYESGSYGDMSGWSAIPYVAIRPKISWIGWSPYALAGYGYSWWSFDRSQDMADKDIFISMGNAPCYMLALGLERQISWLLWSIETSYFNADVPLDAHYGNGAFANVVGNDDRSGERTIGQPEVRIMLIGRRRF